MQVPKYIPSSEEVLFNLEHGIIEQYEELLEKRNEELDKFANKQSCDI